MMKTLYMKEGKKTRGNKKGSEREMADISTLPTYEMNSFALWVAKLAEKYFEDPDVKRRYEAWEKENERNEKGIRDFSYSDSYNTSDRGYREK